MDPENGHVLWEIHKLDFWEGRGFLHHSRPPEVVCMVVEANLANGDEETADKLLCDWMRTSGARAARVSRYVPGTHFHALDAKFDTLEEAQAHIRAQRMIVEPGVKEVRLYRDGD